MNSSSNCRIVNVLIDCDRTCEAVLAPFLRPATDIIWYMSGNLVACANHLQLLRFRPAVQKQSSRGLDQVISVQTLVLRVARPIGIVKEWLTLENATLFHRPPITLVESTPDACKILVVSQTNMYGIGETTELEFERWYCCVKLARRHEALCC